MFTQEEVSYRIKALVPDAKFSLRIFSEQGALCCINPIRVGDWLVDWSSDNGHSCPTIEQLADIPGFDLQAIKDDEELRGLSDSLKNNMAFVAAYELAKTANPALIFKDYVSYIKMVRPD